MVGLAGVVVFVLLIAALVAGIVAVLVWNSNTKSSTSTLSVSSSDRHVVGDTARTVAFDVTLNSASDPYVDPNAQVQPPPGFHFVFAELTIANTGDRDLVVSAEQLIQLADASGRMTEQVPGTSAEPIEGPLAAHATRHGAVVFKVPDTVTIPLTLRVRGDVTAEGVAFTIP